MSATSPPVPPLPIESKTLPVSAHRRSTFDSSSRSWPVASVWRYEFKYVVARHLRSPLIADLRAFTVPDDHCGPDRCYEVRSLYLDSPDWSCLRDKSAGVCDRHKLRVRAYPNRDGDIRDVKFEVKHRRDGRIAKDVAAVSRADYERLRPRLWSHGGIGAQILRDHPGLLPFFGLKSLYARVPVLVMTYRRRAMRVRTDRATRITIDDRLMGGRSRDLLDQTASMRPLMSPLDSVLEVKVLNSLPYWLHRLIGKYRLTVQPVSKYAMAATAGPFGLEGDS